MNSGRVPSAPSYPAEPEPRCVSALRAGISSRGGEEAAEGQSAMREDRKMQINHHLRADYERVRASHPEANLPAYDDMTPEQRENHRKAYEAHRGFMNELGNAIRSGGPLPTLR